MDQDNVWSSKVSHLTGMKTAAILQAAFEWIDCGGVSSRLKTWHHSQSAARMKKQENDETLRTSSGHSDKLTSPQDCFLLTLCKLRTGLSFSILAGWFGIPYTECVRIFSTWIPYMARFFRSEFPVPTTEELEGRIGAEWMRAYGAPVRLVPDASEFAMESPTSRMAARTVWSEYKQRHTIKVLACICPAGAFVWTSDGFPGRISDLQICEASGFFDIINEGDTLASDKGFDSITPKVLELHAQVLAPTRRWQGNPNFVHSH